MQRLPLPLPLVQIHHLWTAIGWLAGPKCLPLWDGSALCVSLIVCLLSLSTPLSRFFLSFLFPLSFPSLSLMGLLKRKEVESVKALSLVLRSSSE